MTTLTITLRDEDQNFIQRAMKSGRYLSENEAVADALAELRAHEEVRRARFAELREKVQAGFDQLDRGESAEWNVEEIKTKGRALFSARNRSVS